MLQEHHQASMDADVGLVLMDSSLQTIGYDRGAAAILNGGGGQGVMFSIPPEIEEAIRTSSPADLPAIRIHFRRGTRDYSCHAYVLRSQRSALPQTMMALHLERDWSGRNAVAKLTTEYGLTTREREALSGIALGLSTKEVAYRMQISPNTVKSFLRLIMSKVGVSTRGELIAKLLASCDTK